MKNQIAQLLLWITLPLVMPAQNNWFVGFDLNFEAVEYALAQQHDAEVITRIPDKLIQIKANHDSISYLFNHGLLYRIDMKKVYNQKKTARKAFDGCLKYFTTISAAELTSTDEGSQKHWAAYKGADFYNLKLSVIRENVAELILSSRHAPHMPLAEWEQYQHLVEQDGTKVMELLEKHLQEKGKMAFY